MRASVSALSGLVVIAGLSAGVAFAQSPASGQERDLVGAIWSGGAERNIAGYESYGGAIVRDAIAVGLFRSRSDPRDWIFVSTVEIGRDGVHALWRGADTVRASGRTAESSVAYACKRASRGLKDEIAEPGVVGLVGSEYAIDNGAFGLLRAEMAWEVASDGRFIAIREPVVCADEGYGL